jgi:hypothetical protein
MATHQNITHEYYHTTPPSLEIWETLWEENQWRMWYKKSYSEFYNQEIVDEIEAQAKENGNTPAYQALLYIKQIHESYITGGPGFFHVVKSDGKAISIRAFIRIPFFMEEIDTIAEIVPDYKKDTCATIMNMNMTDPDGSSTWVDMLYDVEGFADELAKVPTLETRSHIAGVCDDGGCKRWYGIPTGKIQKAYIIRGNTAGWVMQGGHTPEKIADNSTPLYYFGPFGWPEGAGTIGEPE